MNTRLDILAKSLTYYESINSEKMITYIISQIKEENEKIRDI